MAESVEISLKQGQLDQLYDVLSHPYRRAALETLSTTPIGIDTLVEAVLSAVEPADKYVTSDIEHSLYHIHLPKLVKTGLIRWDGNEVSLSKGVREIQRSVPVPPSWVKDDVANHTHRG
jgi:hypothetical protein